MASKNNTDLTLTIRAFDKATGPLRALTSEINKINEPMARLGKDFGAFSKASGLGPMLAGFKGVGSAVGKVKDEAFALGARLAGVAGIAGFALYKVVRGAVDAGDELGEMAQRVGLGVDAFASLRYAAAQSDIEQDNFNAGLDTFVKGLGEAKAGTGRMLAFLNKIGPSFAQQVKGAKSTEEALSLVTTAFEKVTDPAKRAALAGKLFGDKQFGVFLGQGSAAIQKLQSHHIGLVGSQQRLADESGKLDNTLRDTSLAFGAATNALALELYPAVTQLSEGITKFLGDNREGLKKWATETGGAISAWVKDDGLKRLTTGLQEFGSWVGRAVDFLGGFKGAAIAVGLVMAGPLVLAIGGLAVSLVTLGIALAPFAPAILVALPFALAFGAALVGVAAAAYQLGKGWDDLGMIFGEWWGDVVGYFQSGWAKISPIVDALTAVAGIAMNPLGAAVDFGSSFFGSPVSPAAPVAATPPPRAGATATESRVMVDFANVPKGTSVTTDKNGTAPVDLSLGYSMAGSY